MADYLVLIGGVGLFLFGMQAMTDALKDMASRQARQFLGRFTRTPFSGVVTGALTTAVIQSSSATLVMTIGFVGAGLLTFAQALGVIFGANIGTTITGWMVLFLGFKLSLGAAALPVLFLGSLMRILARGQWARLGSVLAGLALIFIGLGMMQDGMAQFEGRITPASFPDDSLGGRLLLVLIGIATTVITQSSSAGVAATLVLLSAGTVSFDQAAAMVIGMHIGSTFTALLAAFGGSREMRRTALANLLYMLATGALGFALLPMAGPFLRDVLLGGDKQVALVAFHTLFNVTGVMVMLPLVGRFAALIERIMPDQPDPLVERLDTRLLSDAGAALDTAGGAARDIGAALFTPLGAALLPGGTLAAMAGQRKRVETDLEHLRDFVTRIVIAEDMEHAANRHGALLHMYDHLHRLAYRSGQEARINTVLGDARLRRYARVLGALMQRHVAGEDVQARLERLALRLEAQENRLRRDIMRRAHLRGMATARLFAVTDGIRWLRRTTAHVGRIVHYQRETLAEVARDSRDDDPAPTDPEESGGAE